MTDSGNSRGWLRPAVIVGIAVVVLVLALFQPWRQARQLESILEDARSVAEELQSYRISQVVFVTTDNVSTPYYLEIYYQSPDRYRLIYTKETEVEESVLIGDLHYRNGEVIGDFPWWEDGVHDSLESVFEELVNLTDVERHGDEKVNNIICLHYSAYWNMDKHIEEAVESVAKDDEALRETIESELRSSECRYEFWIGKYDSLLRKIQIDQTLPAQPGQPSQISTTMTAFSFNRAITIDEPLEDDDTLSEGWTLVTE